MFTGNYIERDHLPTITVYDNSNDTNINPEAL